MPFFKSTYNIIKTPWEDEVYESKRYDSDKLILPPGGPDDPKNKWDYNRELQIEDVDIWEVLYEAGGNFGLYASWKPYAEFYLFTGRNRKGEFCIETYYGQGAQEQVQRRIKELDMPVFKNELWVDDDELWLYQKPENKKIIITPNKIEY